jgi:transcriptional regulator with XRE-family HTH domain
MMATKLSSSPRAGVVADRVRQLREGLGLNQTEFAKELGVSRSYLSDIENYKGKITLDFIFHLVRSFEDKSKDAGLLALLAGDKRPVPWGDAPERSPLALILGLDTRALQAALESLQTIESIERTPLTPEHKARYVRQALYIYMSELIRAENAGMEISEARQVAKHACDAVAQSLELPG